MQDIFIARQPIYHRDLSVLGYEILFRSNEANQADVIDGDDATSQVLINTLIEIGLDKVVGDKYAFINMTRNFLIGKLPFPLNKTNVVLEILEDIEVDEQLVEAIKDLKNNDGYLIALDDFIYSDDKLPLIALADMIKIDIAPMDATQIEQQVKKLRGFNAKLLAEKVETQEEFEHCMDLGFDYFQGYFLSKPKIIKGQRIQSSRIAILHLMTEIQDPEISFKQLEQIISKDVAMSYRILRYINSAGFNFAKTIDSIQQAITILGLRCIKAWVTIIALTKFDDKPYDLMVAALVRGKMCELLANKLGTNSESGFIVGLFSALDALMDKPMDEILSSLPLTQEVNEALLYKQGELGKILHTVLCNEKGDWQNIGKSGTKIDNKLIRDAYLESIAWAGEISKQLLANK